MTARRSRRSFLAHSGALIVAFAIPAPLGRRRRVRRFAPRPADQLDSWLVIGRDESITVHCGKVELGTGVSTALRQIVAEELDLPVSRIEWVQGDSALTVDQGPTVGSRTIASAGPQLRAAAAEARLALLELAASRLNVPVHRLTTRDGVVTAGDDTAKRITFGQLIGDGRFDRKISGRARPKPGASYTVVGKSVPRVDIPGKVTGRHQYVHDVRLPNMVHGRVVRPAAIGAEPLAVNEGAARKLPGVIAVVRRGSFVGVVAEREEQAVRAARALDIRWSESAPLPDETRIYEAIRQWPSSPTNLAGSAAAPEIDPSFRVVRATYHWPFQLHASMGPSCGLADVRDGEATIWSATQGAHRLVEPIAALIGLAPERVRVIWVEGSGCYGHNGADDAAADAALLSTAVRRPVRVQWMRHDEHGWEPQGSAMVRELEGLLAAGGTISSWTSSLWSATHGSRPGGPNARTLLAGALAEGPQAASSQSFRGAERDLRPIYRLGAERTVAHHLTGFPSRTSSLRGLGSPANAFANESFMDELAAAARSDPVEFRLRHLDDPRARAVIEAAARLSGWSARPSPRAGRRGSMMTGRGIGFVRYDRAQAYVAAVAEVEVARETGRVHVRRVSVAHDCGLVVNPDGVRNQIEGNVVQAISRTLKERVRFDRRKVTSLDWSSYPILTFSELPDAIAIELIDRPDQPSMGAGEPAMSPIPGAIGNALFDATGARVREVPFTPDRIRAALAGLP